MPAAYQLTLTREQRAELEEIRDHAAVPYLRERTAVLHKIAAGLSIVGGRTERGTPYGSAVGAPLSCRGRRRITGTGGTRA